MFENWLQKEAGFCWGTDQMKKNKDFSLKYTADSQVCKRAVWAETSVFFMHLDEIA